MNLKNIEDKIIKLLPSFILGTILIFATSLRLDMIWQNQLTYDEAVTANLARNWLITGLPIRNLPGEISYFDHPPTWWLLTGTGIEIFGKNKFGIRFFSTGLNLMLVILIYFCTRELLCSIGEKGKVGALTVALLFAMNPVFVQFSRNSQIETGNAFFGMLSIFLLLRGISKESRNLMFWAGFSGLLGVTVKYLGIYFVFIDILIILNIGRKKWYFLFYLMLGMSCGGIFLFLLIWLIYPSSMVYFHNSILIPFEHVLYSKSVSQYWRVMEMKSFLDSLYGWFHPITLFFVLSIVAYLVELLHTLGRKLGNPSLERSKKFHPIPFILCCASLSWLVFLTLYSATSRSIPYASLGMPVALVFVGFQLQRLVTVIKNRVFQDGPGTGRVFQIDNYQIIRYVKVYGPGSIIILFLWFLNSSYHFGNTMFEKERARNIWSDDPTEVIGSFISSRFPSEHFFVSITQGPQISFYSGFRYDQTYNVSDWETFEKRVENTNIFILMGIMKQMQHMARVDEYLRSHFRSAKIYRYIPYYYRSP